MEITTEKYKKYKLKIWTALKLQPLAINNTNMIRIYESENRLNARR